MAKDLKIALGSDHAGYRLKNYLVMELGRKGYLVKDVGTDNSKVSVDYPDFANMVCDSVSNGEVDFGILICGSGIGMSMTANKFKDIRAALCYTVRNSKLAREHNNANVLCLAGRETAQELAMECVEAFLSASFAGGRHEKRVIKMSETPYD